MARKRRGFGAIRRSFYKVNRASMRGGGRPRQLPFIVKIGRSSTGHYTAYACPRYKGRSVKGRHCTGVHGGRTPTAAAGRALEALGKQLVRQGRED